MDYSRLAMSRILEAMALRRLGSAARTLTDCSISPISMDRACSQAGSMCVPLSLFCWACVIGGRGSHELEDSVGWVVRGTGRVGES